MSLRKTLLATAVLGATLAVVPGAAHAQDLVVRDAKGDVVSFHVENDQASDEPAVANGDVRKVTFRHLSRKVTVNVAFAELTRTSFRGVFVPMVTNAGLRRQVDLFSMTGFGTDASVTRPNGEPVKCSVGHHIDYAADTIRLSVPRGCLGDPRWVRVGVASFWGKDFEGKTYVDDALRPGIDLEGVEELALSPRIRKG